MSKFQQQLKRGLLEMLILQIINQQPTYGYNIRFQLKEKSHMKLSVEDGTLYPILYRLEGDELITASWELDEAEQKQISKPKPRKIYTITEKGIQSLHAQHSYWLSLSEIVNVFFEEDL